jgi:hypothetical protein
MEWAGHPIPDSASSVTAFTERMELTEILMAGER